MIFETLMKTPLLVQVLGLTFVTIIIIGIIEVSYRAEEMGEDEQ